MDKIISFLSFTGKYSIIGSAVDKNLKYSADVDAQEYIELKGDPDKIRERIYELFKKKFKDAYKNPNMFIIDFKLGVLEHNMPIRWDLEKMENEKDLFIESLKQKSVIKIDMIYYDSKQVLFKEYSVNYYFLINEKSSYPFIRDKDMTQEFIQEYFKYMKAGNYFKALKRLYSLMKIEKITKGRRKLINFLNSDTGLLYQKKSSLETIELLLENNFRKPNMKIVEKALKKIDESRSPDQLQKIINEESLKFIKENINIMKFKQNSD